ncbi:Predicted membrane protein [Serratia quinivorans]|uniref:zinc ribbon domain-containing protein n=1 Tax=Serratia quinivorans TaxID=137545 RepID=UPI002177F709|nr:zinc ribbon domain-containing protein [Serratia quinivorans]CAI0845011.1 Predicted membrane protein [Serratia quinivorans]CAI0892029.1 Predicted membrane protein [Serratia quinivorans]CAI1682431.1 Predicted membrane protein [Serratia quinivorans]CAI2080947.1 Predicted membrane protein [Serratia quinivorans]CAI2438260.1 Predicted membrane protein [Serratia quinivorans]
MYCNKCGATIEVDDKFCKACGTSTYSTKTIGEKNPWTTSTPLPSTPPNKPINTALIEKPEENSTIKFIKKWGYRVVILVVAGMVAVIAKPLGQILTDKYQASRIWEDAPVELEKVKKSMGLPKRLDEYTTLNNMFITGHELHYEYVVNDIKIDTSTKPEVTRIALDAFNKALCQNVLITKFGGISVYTYKFPNDDITYKFTKSDCRP